VIVADGIGRGVFEAEEAHGIRAGGDVDVEQGVGTCGCGIGGADCEDIWAGIGLAREAADRAIGIDLQPCGAGGFPVRDCVTMGIRRAAGNCVAVELAGEGVGQ
jgi:hypothetical protein